MNIHQSAFVKRSSGKGIEGRWGQLKIAMRERRQMRQGTKITPPWRSEDDKGAYHVFKGERRNT